MAKRMPIHPFIKNHRKSIRFSMKKINWWNVVLEVVRVIVPALTEERRKELVKKVKQESEQAKISIRNIRRKTNDDVKKLKDKSVPEDEVKQVEKEIQDITDKFIAECDKIYAAKEKEIMTV